MERVFILLFSLMIFMAHCGAQEVKKSSKQEKKEGWQLLFNGKDLHNWKTFNGGKVSGWKVIDGILHNSGVGSDHGGDIITIKQFENFELYLEWSITPLSNSGVFIRVQEGQVDAIQKSGPEYQLCDDIGVEKKRNKLRNKNQYTASNYAMHEPENPKLKPLGEWNTTQIIVNGEKVEHWLNGEKVLEYELWSDDWNARKMNSKWKDEKYYGMAEKGHIGLQDHGGLTKFRNIKIREL